MSSIDSPVFKSPFIPKNPTTDNTDGGIDPSTTFKSPYLDNDDDDDDGIDSECTAA